MMNFGLLWINGRLTFEHIEHILTLSQHTQEKIVTKWIVILAIVILAPTFVVNVFSNGVISYICVLDKFFHSKTLLAIAPS